MPGDKQKWQRGRLIIKLAMGSSAKKWSAQFSNFLELVNLFTYTACTA